MPNPIAIRACTLMAHRMDTPGNLSAGGMLHHAARA